MTTLVVDVGGNNVKMRCEGYDERASRRPGRTIGRNSWWTISSA